MNKCLLLFVLFYSLFTSVLAQEADTLVIEIPRTNSYAIYINDTLYYCQNNYIDSSCENMNTSLYSLENAEFGDFYPIKEGNIQRYYLKRWFRASDSVYANGEATFYTDDKPLYDDIIPYEGGCYDEEHGDCTKENPRLINGYDSLGPSAQGTILRGLREGKWKYGFYGLADVEEQYVNGIREGEYRVYTREKNDSTLYQTTFKNGTGVEKMYRNSYGTKKHSLYRITHFKNGKQDLSYPLKEFHPNGSLARLTDYQKGLITSYYSTGVLRSIRVVSFLDSLTNGKPTPIPKVASYFDRQGELISTFTFDKEGKVIDRNTYKNIKIANKGVWYLERGNFRYYEKGRKYYQVDENGNEVEVEF